MFVFIFLLGVVFQTRMFYVNGEGSGVYELVWEDSFYKLDSEKWSAEVNAYGGGNDEFQAYTPSADNAYVKDNTLFIRPTLLSSTMNNVTGETFGKDFHKKGTLNLSALFGECHDHCLRINEDIPPILSANLVSRFKFRYGRVEIEAKMSAGDWIIPVIALLPSDSMYGNWPRSGAVTMATSMGNRSPAAEGRTPGVDQMEMLMFWGPHHSAVPFHKTMTKKFNHTYNFADYYHKYTLDWSEEGMVFSLDDKEVLRVCRPDRGFWDWGSPWNWKGENPWQNATLMAPFDQEFQLSLWVSVGGNVFPESPWRPWKYGDRQNKATFWDARDLWLPTWRGEATALKIRSLKIYQQKHTPNKAPGEESSELSLSDPRAIGALAAAAVMFLATAAGIVYCLCKRPGSAYERNYHPDGEHYTTQPRSPGVLSASSVLPPLMLRQQSLDNNVFYDTIPDIHLTPPHQKHTYLEVTG